MEENNCLKVFLLVFVAYIQGKSKKMVIFLNETLKFFESKFSFLQTAGVPYSTEENGFLRNVEQPQCPLKNLISIRIHPM